MILEWTESFVEVMKPQLTKNDCISGMLHSFVGFLFKEASKRSSLLNNAQVISTHLVQFFAALVQFHCFPLKSLMLYCIPRDVTIDCVASKISSRCTVFHPSASDFIILDCIILNGIAWSFIFLCVMILICPF